MNPCDMSVFYILGCIQLHVALEVVGPRAVFWKSFVKYMLTWSTANTWHPPTFGFYLFSPISLEKGMAGGKHNDIDGRGRGRAVLIWLYRNWQTAIKLSLSAAWCLHRVNHSSIVSNCPYSFSFSFWKHLSHLTFFYRHCLTAWAKSVLLWSLWWFFFLFFQADDGLLCSSLQLCCAWEWNFFLITHIWPLNSWAANRIGDGIILIHHGRSFCSPLQNLQWQKFICATHLLSSATWLWVSPNTGVMLPFLHVFQSLFVL